MARTTLIVLMSPAGGAKSVIANYLQETKEDCVIVSRKQIERAGGSVQDYYDAINLAIGNHKYVVVNDYNTTLFDREQLFYEIKCIGLHIIGIWIEMPVRDALEHNRAKDLVDQVDDELITTMFEQGESPREYELFDDVVFISKDGIESGMGASKYFPKIDDMYRLLDKI